MDGMLEWKMGDNPQAPSWESRTLEGRESRHPRLGGRGKPNDDADDSESSSSATKVCVDFQSSNVKDCSSLDMSLLVRLGFREEIHASRLIGMKKDDEGSSFSPGFIAIITSDALEIDRLDDEIGCDCILFCLKGSRMFISDKACLSWVDESLYRAHSSKHEFS